MNEKEPSRAMLLTLDIDCRIADLWTDALEIEEWTLEAVAAFMRAAYGRGYIAALQEENRGALCADNGYVVPKREASA